MADAITVAAFGSTGWGRVTGSVQVSSVRVVPDRLHPDQMVRVEINRVSGRHSQPAFEFRLARVDAAALGRSLLEIAGVGA